MNHNHDWRLRNPAQDDDTDDAYFECRVCGEQAVYDPFELADIEAEMRGEDE